MKTMKNWLLAAVLVAALTAVVACGGKYLSHTYRAEKTLECSTLALDDQTVAISETQQKNYLGDRTILRRHYQLGNGDTVTQARVQNGNWASRWEAVETWDLPSKEGTIWYVRPGGRCMAAGRAFARGPVRNGGLSRNAGCAIFCVHPLGLSPGRARLPAGDGEPRLFDHYAVGGWLARAGVWQLSGCRGGL